MGALLHFNMYKEIGVKQEEVQLYDHAQKSVKASVESTLTILWNQVVRTA
jgi:hypothetical protein